MLVNIAIKVYPNGCWEQALYDEVKKDHPEIFGRHPNYIGLDPRVARNNLATIARDALKEKGLWPLK